MRKRLIAGLTSTVRPASKLRRRTRTILSSLHLYQEKNEAGVPPLLAFKRSG